MIQSAQQKPKYFLGLIKEKYVKTIYGATHGITGILSVFLGAIVFIAKCLCLVDDTASGNTLFSHVIYALFRANMISSFIVAIFYWNKVQSWRMGTTKATDRNVTTKQMQNANRGRGVVTLILQSLYPLVVATATPALLNDPIFSSAVALSLTGLALYTAYLFKDFFRALILVYGMFQLGLATAIFQYGSMAALHEAYPLLIDHIELEAALVITISQHGFMMYYLRSRRLINEEAANKQCRVLHTLLFRLYTARMMIRAYNLFPSLPAVMVPHALIILIGGILPLFIQLKPKWGNNEKEKKLD